MVYRAAIIGCGNIGSLYADDPLIKGVYTHAGAYTACKDTTLVAVCDLDQEKAVACAKKWNVPSAYTDIQKLLDEQSPDIVSICTPDPTHITIVNQLLKLNSIRAVLVEKPLSLNVEEAEYIINLCKERRVNLAVNYSRRYSKGHANVRAMIRAGHLGTIQSVSGCYTKGIYHNGTHWLDLARWLVGEVVMVQGFSTQKTLGDDPTLNAWFMFDNEATGYLHGLDADAFSLFEMDIIGTKGRIRIIDSGHRIEYSQVSASPYYSGYQTLLKIDEYDGNLESTLLNAVENLILCLINNSVPTCSGEDGLAALRIASSIVNSAQLNCLASVG